MCFEIRFFTFRHLDLGIEPRVLKELLQAAAVVLSHGQALIDAILELGAESEFWSECNVGVFDLGIGFEGNVSADHVIQQDAQAPNGQTVPFIASEFDPFWWGVNSSAIKVGIDVIMEPGSRPEVNELDFVGLGVNENVFVLDVSVDDLVGVTLGDSLHDLLENEPGQVLLEGAVVGDEVEQVFAGVRRAADPLHDQKETVGKLEIIHQPNHTLHLIHLLHQGHFQRNFDVLFVAAAAAAGWFRHRRLLLLLLTVAAFLM